MRFLELGIPKNFKSGLLDSTCIFEISKDNGRVGIGGRFASPMAEFILNVAVTGSLVCYSDEAGGVIKLNNRMSRKARGSFHYGGRIMI